MDAGPIVGVLPVTTTSRPATRRASASMRSVIDRVVLGFTTVRWIVIGSGGRVLAGELGGGRDAHARGEECVCREAYAAADEPAVVGEDVEGRDEDGADGAGSGDDGGGDGCGVVALAVVVGPGLVEGEQVVDDHLLLVHDVVVGDEDSEQWPDEGAEGVQRVVDGGWVVVQVPRGDQHRADGGDHAAHPPGDLLRVDVGEVERGGDEVGDDVDADGGDHEGQRAEHDGVDVVQPGHGVHRVDDQFAEHRPGGRRGDHDQQREHQ